MLRTGRSDLVPAELKATPEVKTQLRDFLRARDDESLMRALQIDFRHVSLPYIGPRLPVYSDGSWSTFYGERLHAVRTPGGAIYHEVHTFSLQHLNTPEDVERYPWPKLDWFDYTAITARCKELREYAVVFTTPGVFQRAGWGRPYTQILLDLLEKPDFSDALFEKYANFHTARLERVLEAAQGGIDIVCVTDDFGHQGGLMMSPSTWRRFFKKRLKRMVEITHHFGVSFMLHSCGSIREIFPDLIEIGVDILDPVQTTARGMEPRELVHEFGEKICFQGAIDTQQLLPNATTEELRKSIRETIDIFRPARGYILSSCNNIQPGTPLENILAMYDIGLRFS